MSLRSLFTKLKQHLFKSSPPAAPSKGILAARLIKAKPQMKLTKDQQKNYVAIDCEMVGVGPGGTTSALARVSVVDFDGNVLLDSYVKPNQPVTQYRTWVSGIRPRHLKDASGFRAVKSNVAKLIDKKVLVGHAIHHDLRALKLHHPPELIRDTSTYQPLWVLVNTTCSPSLKNLAKVLLDLKIQKASHCSIDDAKATMAIYRTQQEEWEDELMKAKKQQPVPLTPAKAPNALLPKQASPPQKSPPIKPTANNNEAHPPL
ncbi:hypothetical protein PCANC_12138 [Puccinia coronata f. sp. avenae]|uniref:RNA exonuclease 4 n=1 Tax=Puccinia coronata f. sp. avenae TaxID=200324 RepID=A0A2N5VGF1_9BASI|nr:hypothetical protein PCANC_14948 [Puccinia coronata f. sp. avenae]PLW23165.1 hypothetical protein PCASD_16507 [Puccinia coronata f. sp. avenae]PLW49064.1 hypothetical protein PCANC_12138 [Puccinia coronata f. sp. avenae]